MVRWGLAGAALLVALVALGLSAARPPDRESLKDSAKELGSYAEETRLVLGERANGSLTPQFSHAHLAQVADEVDALAQQLGGDADPALEGTQRALARLAEDLHGLVLRGEKGDDAGADAQLAAIAAQARGMEGQP